MPSLHFFVLTALVIGAEVNPTARITEALTSVREECAEPIRPATAMIVLESDSSPTAELEAALTRRGYAVVRHGYHERPSVSELLAAGPPTCTVVVVLSAVPTFETAELVEVEVFTITDYRSYLFKRAPEGSRQSWQEPLKSFDSP